VKPIDGVYLWELGTLDAKAAKGVTVTLKQAAKGDVACQAWVTLTGTSAMKAVAKEPKLEMTIEAPEKVVLGEKIRVKYTVTNTGDYEAEGVGSFLDQTYLDVAPENRPKRIRLKPGETYLREEEFTATRGGVQKCLVMSNGEEGLSANARTTVQVLVPKLYVSVAGPVSRQIGGSCKYTVSVKNGGEVSVKGVTVCDTIPAGFKVSNAGDGKQSGDKLTWAVGDLAPGAEKQFTFTGTTHAAGPMTHKAEATGDRNTKATGECVTTVEGIPGLRMELVDSVDPVERNGEITYEIKVTNTGTKADSGVTIVCELPKELKFVSCSGPTKGEEVVTTLSEVGTPGSVPPPPAFQLRRVYFDPISDLAPKTEAVFKVKVKGTGTGDVRFKAEMSSKHLTTSVKKEESTRVYGE
jgi:uncharacterized repeat protein (TIGR01451 family)